MSPSRPAEASRVVVLAVAAGIAILGVFAGRVGFGAFLFQSAVVLCAAGWLVAGAGLVAWSRASWSREGPLVVTCGAATFIAPLAYLPAGVLATTAGWSAWMYVAVAGHVLATHPRGVTSGGFQHIVVASGYVVGLAVALAVPAVLAAIPMGLWLAGVLVVIRLRYGRGHPDRVATIAGLILVAGLVSGPVLRMLLPIGTVNPSGLRLVALTVAMLLVVSDLLATTATRARITDLVLRPGRETARSVQEPLRRATGDATLVIGFPLDAQTADLVDLSGRPLDDADIAVGRARTPLLRDGRTVAVVIHEAGLGADTGIAAAVARAAELEGTNARLQAELRTEIDQLQASRGRLQAASDEERRELGAALRSNVTPILDRLRQRLDGIHGHGPGVDAALRARVQLGTAHDELLRLAEGLLPRVLLDRGLLAAVEDLVRRSPVAATLSWDGPLAAPGDVATTAYFLISEALANVAKHACASSVAVTLSSEADRLVVEVEDDGVGGADPRKGTGLVGLGDRVGAIGGMLEVGPGARSGTVLRASLPFAPAA